MKTCFYSFALLMLVVGCATVKQGPQIIEGNEVSVVISAWQSNQGFAGALALADSHCAQYGRKARYARNLSDFTRAYDCVKD